MIRTAMLLIDENLDLGGFGLDNAGDITLAATKKIVFGDGTQMLTAPVAATAGSIGLVKPDGTTVTIDPDGTLHASASGGGAVDSFNGRAGIVTLLKADVEGVLTGTVTSHDHAGVYSPAGHDHTGTYLSTGGGALSGFLFLHADPTAAFHAATKGYVDAVAATISGGGTGPHTHAAADITSGTFDPARIPDLPTSKITSFAAGVVAALVGVSVSAGTLTLDSVGTPLSVVNGSNKILEILATGGTALKVYSGTISNNVTASITSSGVGIFTGLTSGGNTVLTTASPINSSQLTVNGDINFNSNDLTSVATINGYAIDVGTSQSSIAVRDSNQMITARRFGQTATGTGPADGFFYGATRIMYFSTGTMLLESGVNLTLSGGGDIIGADNVSAASFTENGTSLSSKYGQLGAVQLWNQSQTFSATAFFTGAGGLQSTLLKLTGATGILAPSTYQSHSVDTVRIRNSSDTGYGNLQCLRLVLEDGGIYGEDGQVEFFNLSGSRAYIYVGDRIYMGTTFATDTASSRFQFTNFAISQYRDVQAANFYGGGGLDLAEAVLNPDADLAAGDLAVIDDNDDEAVKKHGGLQYDKTIAGVVSTDPGMLLGAASNGAVPVQEGEEPPANPEEGKAPIALAGRVPCKVTTKYVDNQGAEVRRPIQKGYLLVASSIPGHAMAADPSDFANGMLPLGSIIGKAMQTWDPAEGDPQEGVIKVWVNLG